MSTETYANLRVVRETDETRPCKLYIRSGSRNVIASVNDDPETVAMFQLFAAAPEMLEALERILPAAMALARKQASYDQFGDIDFAKATIAKAKGGDHEHRSKAHAGAVAAQQSRTRFRSKCSGMPRW
jgi:hypothetical protein